MPRSRWHILGGSDAPPSSRRMRIVDDRVAERNHVTTARVALRSGLGPDDR